jgi:hypothetical protein
MSLTQKLFSSKRLFTLRGSALRLSTLVSPAILALGLGLAQGSQATTISFTGFNVGSEAVQLASPFQGTVSAGEFAMSADGMPLTSFCIDLMQSIRFGQSYSNYTPVALTGQNENINALRKLLTNRQSLIDRKRRVPNRYLGNSLRWQRQFEPEHRRIFPGERLLYNLAHTC